MRLGPANAGPDTNSKPRLHAEQRPGGAPAAHSVLTTPFRKYANIFRSALWHSAASPQTRMVKTAGFLGISARGKADDENDRLPYAGEKSSRRAKKQGFSSTGIPVCVVINTLAKPKPHRQECMCHKTRATLRAATGRERRPRTVSLVRHPCRCSLRASAFVEAQSGARCKHG